MNKTHPYTGAFYSHQLWYSILNISSILNEATDCETQYPMYYITPLNFYINSFLYLTMRF